MKIRVLYEENIKNGHKFYTTIDIPDDDYSIMLDIDYEQRLAEAKPEKKAEVKRCETVQEMFDLMNSKEYNGWRRFHRHLGKPNTPYRKDDEAEDETDVMDTIADDSQEVERNLRYEHEDVCQLVHIRTAFVPNEGNKFIVADFSAIEARVLSWLAGEEWRTEVFASGGDIYCASASQMFKVPVEKHGVNSHLRQKGKIAELALGYGGSIGALKAMGALEMGLEEEELKPLVNAWRASNPNIVKFWWDVDRVVKKCIKENKSQKTNNIEFHCMSGMLFIVLPSGRQLAYVKPRIGENIFGGESVTYEGVGGTKKWERIESYGPKFVENIVQAISRDILMYAMKTLRTCSIVAHVHDEVIIEADPRMPIDSVCEQMGRIPPWAKGLLLDADGYECDFYKKD